MTKQSLFPMSNDIALELIRLWIKPGTPSLAGFFSWEQPANDATVNLGDAYGNISNRYTIRDILLQDVYIDHATGYRPELKVKLATAKEALKKCREHNIPHNKEFSISGIYQLEQVSTSLRELDIEQKCQYRLAILWLNSMLELHNWSVEYLNYLACYCANRFDSDWRLYERSSKGDDIYNAILECAENPIGISVEEENPYYYYDDKVNKNILQFLENKFDTTPGYFAAMFGVESIRDYEFPEIATILALSIEQVKELWSDSALDLIYSNDIESRIVRDFVFNYQSQGVLAGFE